MLMSEFLETLLLFSLPASGKSELRRYLASLTPEQCRGDFRMGPTLQLDDYPYVHLMHRIDDMTFERLFRGLRALAAEGKVRFTGQPCIFERTA